MSLALYGLGVSRGIAIGAVHLLKREELEPIEVNLADAAAVEAEVQRLTSAVAEATQQLRTVLRSIPSDTPSDIGAFIDAHLMMLGDAAFLSEPIRIIRERRCNAEWAVRLQRDALLKVFESMDDPYLRTRRDDVRHVVLRILRVLAGVGPLSQESAAALNGLVVVADDLTPADTVQLQQAGIAAFIIEHGGPTSHTAILARSLNIPAIVGLVQARRYLLTGEPVVVDGTAGAVLVDLDEVVLEYYRARKREERRYFTDLIRLREAPSISRDGVAVELCANIELTADFAAVRRVGAKGVGLYRTEFLYMNRSQPPSEEEQFETYVNIFNELECIPVTVRTVDLGADKLNLEWQSNAECSANPALGVRGVRLCLREPGLFRAQLRAILRASAFGPIRMMVPMLSTIQELRQVLTLLQSVREELRNEDIEFDPNMPVGGMIEVPAAALCAEAFARELDFLSIGTNDLIQYTMAIDRGNETLNYLYDPTNPGVLRLIDMVLRAGERLGKPVAMCGEMAGDLRYVRLLLALGLRAFSVHPAALLEVKRLIANTSIENLASYAERTRSAGSCAEVRSLLQELGA